MERIYGVHNGRYDRVISSTNGETENVSQEDLFNQLGLNKETYRRAKLLGNLPKEIQDLIESGNISPSTASRVIAKLSEEEQEELVKSLPAAQKLTQKQVQYYIMEENRYENK